MLYEDKDSKAGTAPLTENENKSSNLSRRQLLKRVAVLGLSVPFAAQLAACSPTATAVTSSTTSQPARTVRLTYGSSGLTYYAKTRGVFEETLKKKNINVEWLGPFPNHAPTLQAVVGGTADFSFGGSSTPALAALLAGNPLVFTTLILSEPRTTAILVKPDSNIKSVKDLTGKKVAVNRSGLGEFILVAALEKYGIPFDKVERVYLNPPDAEPAFGADKVDAWSIWSGPRELAEDKYKARPIFIEGEELSKQQLYDVGSFLVLDEYAKKNPDLVRAVIDAYKAEAEWSGANLKEAVELTAKQAGYTQAVVDKLVSYKTKSTFIAPDDKASFDLQNAANWLAEKGVIPGKIEVAKYFAKL